jgi:ER degradation enhancer, mannosidase alpha-like 2
MKYQYKKPWYYSVDYKNGNILWKLFSSLQSFWPGIQALYGDVDIAKDSILNFHSIWRIYGSIPEGIFFFYYFKRYTLFLFIIIYFFF